MLVALIISFLVCVIIGSYFLLFTLIPENSIVWFVIAIFTMGYLISNSETERKFKDGYKQGQQDFLTGKIKYELKDTTIIIEKGN